MAEWIGKIITCDRCGKKIKLKYLGDNDIFKTFEDVPNDWKYHLDTGWLCPDCQEAYQNMISMFMVDITFTSK